MLLTCFLITVSILFTYDAKSQENETGTLNILNLKYNLTEKLSFFGEVQLRSLAFYQKYNYHEFKGGINYWIYPNIMVTLGTGEYDTYGDGGTFIRPKKSNEFRIWPQLIMQQSLSSIKIEQRYRTEFRFIDTGYKNRFRYRMGVSYPFGKNKNGYKPFLVSASNEIFLTDKAPFFEKNRLLMNSGFKPSKTILIQMGYLKQFDYKINSEKGKNYFVFGIYKEWSSKKSKDHSGHLDLKDN